MDNYLLFDTHCSKCSQLAKLIEQETNGYITAASIYNPQIHALIRSNGAIPQRTPTLLEVNGKDVQIFTGITLATQLIRKLGLRQTLRIVRIISRVNKTSILNIQNSTGQEINQNRRDFLQYMSSFIALAFLFGLPKASSSQSPLENNNWYEGKGELYYGFILLPAGTKTAESINANNIINLHGAGQFAAETIQFETIEDLAYEIDFPVYSLSDIPSDMQHLESSIIQYVTTKEIWAIRTTYGSPESIESPYITLWSQLKYPRPFPVWPGHNPHLDGEISINPEKVFFVNLPPGILFPTAKGYVVQWIDSDIHSVLIVENVSERKALEDIVGLLTQM